MQKCIVFAPYFGKFPEHFQLWLDSCKLNDFVKFCVFSDDSFEKYRIPVNVEIKQIEFSEFVEFVQSKFEFDIVLNSPYKLCDYKPLYGYIFSEYICGYDYWGNCDLDLIFGDIYSFVEKSFGYDKISYLGHLTFYKNDSRINESFKLKAMQGIDYKDIISNEFHFGFDEVGNYGINSIILKNEYTIAPVEKYAADIYCYSKNMDLVIHTEEDKFIKNRAARIFSYEDGHVYGWKLVNNKIEKTEYMYVHFQKRQMKNTVSDTAATKFLIVPGFFENYKVVDEALIRARQKKGIYYRAFKIKYKAGIKRLKKMVVIKKIVRGKR